MKHEYYELIILISHKSKNEKQKRLLTNIFDRKCPSLVEIGLVHLFEAPQKSGAQDCYREEFVEQNPGLVCAFFRLRSYLIEHSKLITEVPFF